MGNTKLPANGESDEAGTLRPWQTNQTETNQTFEMNDKEGSPALNKTMCAKHAQGWECITNALRYVDSPRANALQTALANYLEICIKGPS
jgi:hypothetical protein